MVVTITTELNMESSELQSWTVLKKLRYRGLLQKEAIQLIVCVGRKANYGKEKENLTHSQKSALSKKKLEDLRKAMKKFQQTRRIYKAVGKLSMKDEIANSTNKVIEKVSECSDMIYHCLGGGQYPSDTDISQCDILGSKYDEKTNEAPIDSSKGPADNVSIKFHAEDSKVGGSDEEKISNSSGRLV